jgi:hypothetical protein
VSYDDNYSAASVKKIVLDSLDDDGNSAFDSDDKENSFHSRLRSY